MRMVHLKSLKNLERKSEVTVNGIIVRSGEGIEKALKRFTNEINRAGVVYELRNFRHFTKPSAKKREALKTAKINKAREKQDNR